MVLNLEDSKGRKVRRFGEMKWINIVFHFSPPLVCGPVQAGSGPIFNL